MRQLLPLTVALSAVICITASCNRTEKVTKAPAPVFSTYLPDSPADTTRAREIYYGLLTPVEVCNIFERLGVPFNDTIILPPENRDLYMSSYKAANMPDTFISDAIRSLNADMSNADSVTMLMNDAYAKIDEHLRQEGSEGTLGLMLMGGWIEAMYLATQLAYDPANPDPQVVGKIAEQKYSLLSLLSFMKNYYSDPMVVFYTKKLKYLNRWFDTFEIYYQPGDVTVDTLRQVITTKGTEMTVTVETLNEIRDYVARLRAEITAV